jgi:hypothetical protein
MGLRPAATRKSACTWEPLAWHTWLWALLTMARWQMQPHQLQHQVVQAFFRLTLPSYANSMEKAVDEGKVFDLKSYIAWLLNEVAPSELEPFT